MPPGPVQCEDVTIHQHMRLGDITVFALAAKVREVYILVRRTNPASVRYIGVPGFVPKEIDCKAKTADNAVTIAGRVSEVAGLVVNPHIVGPAAYRDQARFAQAIRSWRDFEPYIAPREGHYVLDHRRYGVQDNPAKPRLGAVIRWRSAERHENAQMFIHGDYDLFAIVPVDRPEANVFVEEQLRGQHHARGPQFIDVQNFINVRLGVPMILHGEQDHYDNSFNDKVDIFMPDGATVKTRQGSALRQFFQQEFQGRRLHRAGAETEPAGGRWRRT